MSMKDRAAEEAIRRTEKMLEKLQAALVELPAVDLVRFSPKALAVVYDEADALLLSLEIARSEVFHAADTLDDMAGLGAAYSGEAEGQRMSYRDRFRKGTR